MTLINSFLDYIKKNYFNIIIISLLILIISILLFLIFSFVIYKIYHYVNNIIVNNVTNYSDFEPECKKILNEYKNYKIKHIYLVKENFVNNELINDYIIRILKYLLNSKIDIKNGRKDACHTYIILALSINKNEYKFIKLNKNKKLTILKNITINDSINLYYYRVKKQITFNELIEEAKKTYGVKNFYNWDFKNFNCNDLSDLFLKILGIKDKISFVEFTKNITKNNTETWGTSFLFFLFKFIQKFII